MEETKETTDVTSKDEAVVEVDGASRAAEGARKSSDEDAPASDAAPIALDGSVGLGVDLVEIARIKRILARSPRFVMRVYTQSEREYCDAMANPSIHYATRFAAKEAVLKALGTGFAFGIAPADVEVTRNQYGRPVVRLHRKAAEIAAKQGVREIPVSLSYTHSDAVACAMAITADSVRVAAERIDPMEELAKQFKEARSLLDGLPVRNEDGTQTGELPDMPDMSDTADMVDEPDTLFDDVSEDAAAPATLDNEMSEDTASPAALDDEMPEDDDAHAGIDAEGSAQEPPAEEA